MQLRQERGLTQRAISYFETVAEYPSVPALISLARALQVSTDELLGLKQVALAAAAEPHERRLKKFRQVARLPEKDQRAVIRLINSVDAHERKAS